MDKRELILFFACLICFVNKSFAQSSASAYQRVEIHIQPRIEISALKPAEVNVSVNDKKDAASKGQEFRIRSNKDFVVKVNADNTHFTYNGKNKQAPAMAVDKNLYMAVAGNETTEGYTPLSTGVKDILAKGNGGEQTFAVNYKVKNNRKAAEGYYAVGVVYTATEP